MDDSRIKSAREVLAAFFDEEKLRRGGRYAEFFSSWKFLVGEQLAAHSHIADIKNGVLLVEAEHPGWIQLLQLRQTAILDGIAARFPEFGLASIAFRLGTPRPEARSGGAQVLRGASAEGGASDTDRTIDAATVDPIEKLRSNRSLETIADPTLKALLSNLKDTLESE